MNDAWNSEMGETLTSVSWNYVFYYVFINFIQQDIKQIFLLEIF